MANLGGEFFPDEFVEYVKNNPAVMELFHRFAKEAMDAGHKKFSHWLIANRIRWEKKVYVKYSKYKVSNDHIRHMARLLMLANPSFKGFFSLKQPSPKERQQKRIEGI